MAKKAYISLLKPVIEFAYDLVEHDLKQRELEIMRELAIVKMQRDKLKLNLGTGSERTPDLG